MLGLQLLTIFISIWSIKYNGKVPLYFEKFQDQMYSFCQIPTYVLCDDIKGRKTGNLNI